MPGLLGQEAPSPEAPGFLGSTEASLVGKGLRSLPPV